MTVILRSRLPVRLGILAAALALALYFYLVVDHELFLTNLNQLSIESERRVKWWDWKDTSEEVYCRAPHDLPDSQGMVPNVVHFVLLSDEGVEAELSYARFLAIKAAVLRMNATEIKVHTYGLNQTNPWWKEIEPHVTLVNIDRSTVKGPHGLPMKSLFMAHQSDVLRLDILRNEGGIYLDTDVYTLKPFTDLLHNPRDTVMGHEGGNRYGLCNAVIVSRANSSFLDIWQQTYATFNPHRWNVHSVLKPKQLQVKHPDLICPLSPTVFFWPTWAKSHTRYMHQSITEVEANGLRSDMAALGGIMYENQLAFHATAASEYLNGLTPESMQTEDTRFHILLREVAAAPLPKPRGR